MNNIDPSKIRWLKDVTEKNSQALLYFDDYSTTNYRFPLFWTEKEKESANIPVNGDIIVLYQNYKKNGVRLTHLVEIVDDISFIDTNNETARQVRLIHRSDKILNGHDFKYVFRPKYFLLGIRNIHSLDSSTSTENIQQNIYRLFKRDKDLTFYVETRNEKTYLNIPPNKIFKESQSVKISSNIITLIGENGSGKSAILESIFKASINSEELKFVCYSSGQNECFTKLFSELKPKLRASILKEENSVDGNNEYESPLKVFHFDKIWVRLIIAVATSYKPLGRVRSFLLAKNYCRTNSGIDITTRFTFQFNTSHELIRKISSEKEREEKYGVFSDFIHSRYYETIDKLRNKYLANLTYRQLSGKSTKISIDIKDFPFIFGNNIELPINLFRIDLDIFSGAFSLNNAELFFDDLELNDLSDGEFQLLAIYSLIDLFDEVKTIFLFDEIDSHLYYRNIEKLWVLLKDNILGKVITTTHIADSIIQNDFFSLKIIKEGKILDKSIANELKDRFKDFSNNLESYYKVVSKIPYIALVEDESDWFIFKELAKRKLGSNFQNSKIESIQIVKCPCGYTNNGQRFGDAKITWVENFVKANSSFQTKSIFMICDRDDYPINNIHLYNGVQITGGTAIQIENKKRMAYLLSWKRRQIENYLISYTMLNRYSKLEEINTEIALPYRPVENNPMDIRNIQDLEIKTKIQSLYVNAGQILTPNNPEGINFVRLFEVIKDIPASEISEDIEKMYNFIVSKIN